MMIHILYRGAMINFTTKRSFNFFIFGKFTVGDLLNVDQKKKRNTQ